MRTRRKRFIQEPEGTLNEEPVSNPGVQIDLAVP